MTDEEAITRLQQRDIGGLDPLVIRYQVQAVRAAYLICHDRALAEDLVQAAFVRVYERIAQFDARRPFGPWFLRSVVNDALTATTRRARIAPHAFDSADETLALVDPGPALDERLAAGETRAAVIAAVRALPPAQRAAIVLRYYLDLSEAEMAERLDCPPGTVKWRLHAARQRLRRLLPVWLHPGPAASSSIQVKAVPPTPTPEEGGRL